MCLQWKTPALHKDRVFYQQVSKRNWEAVSVLVQKRTPTLLSEVTAGWYLSSAKLAGLVHSALPRTWRWILLPIYGWIYNTLTQICLQIKKSPRTVHFPFSLMFHLHVLHTWFRTAGAPGDKVQDFASCGGLVMQESSGRGPVRRRQGGDRSPWVPVRGGGKVKAETNTWKGKKRLRAGWVVLSLVHPTRGYISCCFQWAINIRGHRKNHREEGTKNCDRVGG